MAPRFAFVPVGSSLHDAAALERLGAGLAERLTGLGGVAVTDVDDPGVCDLPLVLVALTGGVEQRLLDAWHRRHDIVPWEPFVVVAHGGHNSLPAALEALARVEQDGGRGRIAYVDARGDGWRELAEVVDDVRARGALARMRIGVVGTPSDWLVASTPPAEVVARRWGPTLVDVDMEAVIARLVRAPAHAPSPLAAAVVSGARSLEEPGPGDVADAAQVADVLASIAREERLDAVTVRCFDLLSAVHTSGCVALAELNDRGVVAGCEGDIVSTVTMAWVERLLGVIPWMANPAKVDIAGQHLVLAHCTIARSLVTGYRLRSHFESGIGVAIEGDIAAGEVTLVRVGGRDLGDLWLAEGTVVDAPHDEDLCRTQLHVALDRGDLRDLLRVPLGNHVVAVPGRHADRLLSWWGLFVAGAAA